MKIKLFKSAGILLAVSFFYHGDATGQSKWKNVDSLFGPLPSTVHVYTWNDSLDGKPFIAYYVSANLKDKRLDFIADTTYKRRLTPQAFYQKNQQPLVVVNTTFFNFDRHQNLNVVIRNGKMVGFNNHTVPLRGKDTLQYKHPFGSAIGINRKRQADIAWLYSDSSFAEPYAFQKPLKPFKDSIAAINNSFARDLKKSKKWKMQTAVGGGPVLVQDGKIFISNDDEMKFAGKAVRDMHPRTGVGYTKDGRLIILVIQGRSPGVAEGASLEQEARIFLELGCTEAMNLDGGGSSCMLVNGKETIWPSDKGMQRPVPAVLIIKKK